MKIDVDYFRISRTGSRKWYYSVMENNNEMFRATRAWKPEKAEAFAKEMQNDDPEWTYKVKHAPNGNGLSIIEIYDEDGVLIGKV